MLLDDFYKKSYHRQILERLLFCYRKRISGEILDIGSKNRRYDSFLNGKITAVDICPDPDKNVVYGDIEKGLSFSDGSFDGILCLEVFEYLDDYDRAISEIYRLLHPSGEAIFTIPFMCLDHGDNIRFTEKFISSKFRKYFSTVETFRIGNSNTVLYDILYRKIMYVRLKFLRIVLKIIFLLPYYLFLKITKNEKRKDEIYSGLFIIARR